MLSYPSTLKRRKKTSWAKSGTSSALRRRTAKNRRSRVPYRAAMVATKFLLPDIPMPPHPGPTLPQLVLERYSQESGYALAIKRLGIKQIKGLRAGTKNRDVGMNGGVEIRSSSERVLAAMLQVGRFMGR